MAETPVVEDTVVEEPAVEEPVVEEPAVEEPVVEEPVVEEPVAEEPVVEEPVVEEPAVEEPVVEEPADEEPVVEEPADEEPVVEEPADEESVVEETEEPEADQESSSAGGFVVAEQSEVEAFEADEEMRKVELRVGDYVIAVYGAFPEGTELQAAEIPKEAADQMSGKDSLFAYDIRLVLDGEVWQPEEHGTDVQVSVHNSNDASNDIRVNILHVKTDLLDGEGNLSEEALQTTIENLSSGNVETEKMNSDAASTDSFKFDTSSFSGFIASVKQYYYDAALYKPETGKYPGVYVTERLEQNKATAENAQTIGIPSIADANLPDVPTTESPAIIQGAAVGYENRISATEYETISERPDPYSEFRVKILEEQGTDGTVHKKPSGFDGTYVIVRLDVSGFLSGEGSDKLYLHMEQKDNKALMAAATIAKGVAGYVQPENAFTDGLGNRSASYKMSDLVDDGTPYIDVIVFATAANVAGADAGKANTPSGDIPLALYVDDQLQYNSELVDYDPSTLDQNDPNAATKYDESWHAKFFNSSKDAISRYLMKGSDLALETMVENSSGANKDGDTTYWSLKKAMEKPYYDQEIDKDPNDTGSGRTVTLMSEVAITNGLTLQGEDKNNLRKRTLNVNSYDIQVATNTGVEGKSAEDITIQNAWLTIADKSNTTGAEMAIGNNAQFVIDQGGKLIIDETCQLEIEWDGATTTPAADGSTPAQDILNNGQLDLRAGGEIVNNGIITIEGTEGKPTQPGTAQEQQAIESQKGSGEITIRKGATLTNNGALVIYGKLKNLGTLVNNGKYNDVIKSNDPDKGAFDYHKGIQIAWKDDVTQKNIIAGSLTNGAGGTLINRGDIVLTPGTLDNQGLLRNEKGANIYSATATEAIIPITPDPQTPTIVTKRITLNPVELSKVLNSGTLINRGNIGPAAVALNDNIGFGALTAPGNHPELFSIRNTGTIINDGVIYDSYTGNIVNDGIIIEETPGLNISSTGLMAAMVGYGELDSGAWVQETWLYLYENGTFLLLLQDGARLIGYYTYEGDKLILTLSDGTVLTPEADKDDYWTYAFTTAAGYPFEFSISESFVKDSREKFALLSVN